MTWTDAPNGSALHGADGKMIAQLRKLGAGGWSALWCNGRKWDVSDQLAQVSEQSSRWFKTRPAAKRAVEAALAAA